MIVPGSDDRPRERRRLAFDPFDVYSPKQCPNERLQKVHGKDGLLVAISGMRDAAIGASAGVLEVRGSAGIKVRVDGPGGRRRRGFFFSPR
jgi:hypothetical protein